MSESVTTQAAQPIPASIPMPDHEIRMTRWYQLFNRLARPTHDWLVAGGVGWAVWVGPMVRNPLEDAYLIQVLLYAGATFSVRTYEKVRGVA